MRLVLLTTLFWLGLSGGSVNTVDSVDSVNTSGVPRLFSIHALAAQTTGVTPVLDAQHQKTTLIEAIQELADNAIKVLNNGHLEKISKVQQFLQQASQFVGAIVQNLQMTRKLIEVEKDIFELYSRTLQQIDQAEAFPEKWKQRILLAGLLNEAIQAFEVFDIATGKTAGEPPGEPPEGILQKGKGIIDDKGRILLIKNTLKKALLIRKSMRTVVRRTNQLAFKYRKYQRELNTFSRLFREGR